MNSNERLLAVAFSQIGVSELVGPNHEPQVLKYFSEIGHSWVKDDETAWCAAFANWVCINALTEATKKLNARSFLDIGVEVALEDLKPGDVVILWRKSPTAAEGHVGFYVGTDGSQIYLLGGNQNNRVSIGNFEKNRFLGGRRLTSKIL
jgi:uncharacterized protein (TIGR02594 family)